MQIKAEYLKTALLFASKKDVRYYLNGVLFEINNGQARLVATNGEVLCVFRLGETDQKDAQVIIPRDIVEGLRLKSGELDIKLLEDGTAEINANGQYTRFKPVNGRFPDYRRVIPSGDMSGVAAQFNGHIMETLHKAYKLLNVGCKMPMPYISHNGNSGALIDLNCADFTGVAMPFNLTATGMRELPTRAPYWI